MHTQASYELGDTLTGKGHTQARFNQLIETREIIEKFVGDSHFNPEKDFILIAGDLNINGRKETLARHFTLNHPKAQSFLEKTEDAKLNDYSLLMHILGGYGDDKIIDFLREQDPKKESPVTFGATLVDEFGVK